MYDEDQVETGSQLEAIPKMESLSARYNRELQQAEDKVIRLRKLLKLLEANPQVTEIIQLMERR